MTDGGGLWAKEGGSLPVEDKHMQAQCQHQRHRPRGALARGHMRVLVPLCVRIKHATVAAYMHMCGVPA